ncbi:MAG: nucleotide-binding protein [Actinomycetota bacterium]|nr:nucleotide-binding protein [Actinomycetota bacterium]
MSVEIEQLRALAQRLSTAASQESEEAFSSVRRLEDAAKKVARSWSGSSLGYHAVVYYRDFAQPPEGSNFSSEWGLTSRISGTGGEWVEYRYSDVMTYIERIAGDPQLTEAEWLRDQCADEFSVCKNEFCAILTEYLKSVTDPYIDDLRRRAEKLQICSVEDGIRAQLPSTKPATKDPRAASADLTHSPHHEVLARMLTLRSTFRVAKNLAGLANLASGHLERVSNQTKARQRKNGQRIFIGHGRSDEWRKLSDFIQNRLGLSWDEFNRVPTAGLTTVNRLEEMLDNAAMAFLVMTAEDEMTDGARRARENVVHEAGLFQGRLGFKRAVVLVEEGCGEFSNIHGLGHIAFPNGQLEATFEKVRSVLEREGLIRTEQ